jgi:hypothetical protein
VAGLTFLNGTFYGAAYSGGTHVKGTVFGVSRYDEEQMLYTFGKSSSDGAYPEMENDASRLRNSPLVLHELSGVLTNQGSALPFES